MVTSYADGGFVTEDWRKPFARRLVNSLLADLQARQGFDAFWEDMSSWMQTDIKRSLEAKVVNLMRVYDAEATSTPRKK